MYQTLRKSPDETALALHSRGVAYVLVYTLCMNICRWTIGYNVLAVKKKTVIEIELQELPQNEDEAINLTTELEEEVPEDEIVETERPQTQTRLESCISQLQVGSVSEALALLKSCFSKVFHFVAPPVWACFFAIFIGLVPGLKELFFSGNEEDAAPLYFIMSFLLKIGNMNVPLMLMVLGANLSKGPRKTEKLNLLTTILISLVRLVVLPVTALLLIKYLCYTLIGHIFVEDKMMILVLLIQSATPTAISLIVMCTVHQNMVDEMVSTLFYEYLLAIFTFTFFVSFFIFLL